MIALLNVRLLYLSFMIALKFKLKLSLYRKTSSKGGGDGGEHLEVVTVTASSRKQEDLCASQVCWRGVELLNYTGCCIVHEHLNAPVNSDSPLDRSLYRQTRHPPRRPWYNWNLSGYPYTPIILQEGIHKIVPHKALKPKYKQKLSYKLNCN